MKGQHFTGVKTGRVSEVQWEGTSVHCSKRKVKKSFGLVLSGVGNLVMKERRMYLASSFAWRSSVPSSATRYPKYVCLVAEFGEERCDQKKNESGTT